MTKAENEITWKEINIGATVHEPGNASQYKTGDWRSNVPVVDFSKCIKCALCYIFCPEGCITKNDDGFFEIDMYYCKGCGICAEECPTDSIIMKEEKE